MLRTEYWRGRLTENNDYAVIEIEDDNTVNISYELFHQMMTNLYYEKVEEPFDGTEVKS